MSAKTILWVLLTIGLQGCGPGVPGSGVSKTEIRELEPFDLVSFVGMGSAFIKVGEPRSFEITADDNLLALIETRVDDGVLIIRPVESIRPAVDLVVKIGVPDLRGVTLTGATTAEVQEVVSESFDISISGSGTATVTGRTGRLSTSIEGSGTVRVTELQTKSAEVAITGSGDVAVQATDELGITIVGSGRVRYGGDPKVTRNVIGSGTIEPLR